MTRIVVIGGGQAAASLIAKLRDLDFTGPITLITRESELPYQRPPLSKKYLLGDFTRERLLLRPASWYESNKITVMTNSSCTAINHDQRRVEVDGHPIGYDHLVLTTGSTARELPAHLGGTLEGVHTIRTVDDIDNLAVGVAAGRNLVVVGGGYIGLEAAAVSAMRGMHVTVIEAARRILNRVAAPETATHIANLHRRNGVTVLESVTLDRLAGHNRVSGAVLTNGMEIPADLVVTGIGIEPETGLADSAGLRIDNGIAVDAQGRTSTPNIWAAGDCASFPWQGRRIRLESVQNAIEQAEAVAHNLVGKPVTYDPTPWFWSDQYDTKLQIVGLGEGATRVVVRPGTGPNSISHWYFRDRELLAVDAINEPRSYMIGKRVLEGRFRVDPESLADPNFELRSLLTG
ncbi:MAG: FAD/NAD(P)-binding oxidoreductase [Rhodobacteraceae bacterium]|nr:FAD/NAD(P)-binding oxidoreductase [Paracoccaceae bacterium]